MSEKKAERRSGRPIFLPVGTCSPLAALLLRAADIPQELLTVGERVGVGEPFLASDGQAAQLVVPAGMGWFWRIVLEGLRERPREEGRRW